MWAASSPETHSITYTGRNIPPPRFPRDLTYARRSGTSKTKSSRRSPTRPLRHGRAHDPGNGLLGAVRRHFLGLSVGTRVAADEALERRSVRAAPGLLPTRSRARNPSMCVARDAEARPPG